MLTALRTRTARLVACALVVGVAATGCFGGPNESLQSSGYTRELYDLVNADRARHGLPGFGWDNQLGGLAQGWSQYMASAGMGHRNIYEILNLGFGGAAENVIRSPNCNISPAQVEAAWMNSPAHRNNILGPYNVIGIGVVCANGQLWATQDFGRR